MFALRFHVTETWAWKVWIFVFKEYNDSPYYQFILSYHVLSVVSEQ